MKLSGHSYNNSVFSSLLDGLCKDVELKKTASKTAQSPITGMDMFSSTTEETLHQIQDEELESIAGELSFAADRAHVAVTRDDLAIFAKQAKQENLRGKKLERAAQKFCNDLNRKVAAPQCQSVLQKRNIDQQSSHQIMTATYDPDSVNDGKMPEAKFLGCSKNPNTIWDSDALQRFAQIKHGDEQIKDSKEAQKKFAEIKKQEQTDNNIKPEVFKKGITNAGSSASDPVVNNNQKVNSMSIFNNDLDFANIPEQTEGEKIAQLAEQRAQKSAEAKAEWNQVKPPTKLNNSEYFDKLFTK